MNKPKLKTLAICMGLTWAPFALAQESQDASDNEESVTDLGVLYVQAAAPQPELSDVKKTAKKLDEDMVENIRDVVRYDPGISVNESGGRGTSRGYAIRGVEKERVSVEVDGMGANPMVRRWSRNSAFSKSSGAQFEAEFENLKTVDIRKGASSVEGGSGALGGSVVATTKEVGDILDDGREFGGNFKSAYTSKDGRRMLGLSVGLKTDTVEGFIQYTDRQGHEIQAHKDLYKGGAFIENATSKYSADPALRTADGTLWYDAKEVSGVNPAAGGVRNIPNPMDYDSKSLLTKFGYNFTPSHYLGGVFETTKQNYHVREMFAANYWDASPNPPSGLDPEDYLIFEPPYSNASLGYTPSRFYDDKHDNRRVGLEYRFYNNGAASWLPDEATVNVDRRRLKMSTERKDLACAPFPTVDPNCQPTESGQMSKRTATYSDQKDDRIALSAEKRWQIQDVFVQSKLKMGVGRMRYTFDDYEYAIRAVGSNGVVELPYGTDRENPLVAGPIRGKHRYIALNNRVDLTDKLRADIGLRYDRHSYTDDPSERQIKSVATIHDSKYTNRSWDLGLTYRLTDSWSINYRNSSGFRVPTVIEQLGPYFANSEGYSDYQTYTQTPLLPEKAYNQEIGVKWDGSFLDVSASYFQTRYRNLIDRAVDKNVTTPSVQLYHNLHNLTTHGFEFSAKLDGHSAWNKIPDGVEAFATFSQTKKRKQQEIDERFDHAGSYALDAIQPFRIVYGVSYTNPEEKWGVKLTTTYSDGKDPSDLVGSYRQGGLSGTGARSMDLVTKSWAITDLAGHYKIGDDLTLRAGVYNIFNHRYITWEALRQTGFGLDARIPSDNYLALAAPGRNYQVGLEWKF